MAQKHTSRSPSSYGAQDPQRFNKDPFIASLPIVEQGQASTFIFLVRGVVAGQPAIAASDIVPLQDSASQASLTPFSPAETWRSDPGRRVDGTSDQRLSAVISDVNAVQSHGDLFNLPMNMPTWTPLPTMVPSQMVASSRVPSGGGLHNP